MRNAPRENEWRGAHILDALPLYETDRHAADPVSTGNSRSTCDAERGSQIVLEESMVLTNLGRNSQLQGPPCTIWVPLRCPCKTVHDTKPRLIGDLREWLTICSWSYGGPHGDNI